MFLHTVTDMIAGLWGAAVDYTKTLTWLGPVRDLLLAAEGLIGAAGAIITGLALGTVTLGRLTASGLSTASHQALGLQEPAWARSELAQANTTIGQGWKRVQAWRTVTGIITGNAGSIPETAKTEALETFTHDIDTIGSYAEGMKNWDAYDWGKFAGEIGVIFLPGGSILKTTRTVSKSVPVTARIATDTTRVAGHVDLKNVGQAINKPTNGKVIKTPYAGSGNGRVISKYDDFYRYEYNAFHNPGPLNKFRGQPNRNFYGGRYDIEILQHPKKLYRVGEANKPLGQWFTESPPKSLVEVRIDAAVKEQWLDKNGVLTGKSLLDTVYEVEIPTGTVIYKGPVGSQGGLHQGGLDINQIYVKDPWNIREIRITGSKTIQ